MSEAKTEAPTPRRRQELRRKGQVARSQELGGAAVLLAGVVALRVFGGMLWGDMQEMMRGSFLGLTADELTATSVMGGSEHSMLVVLKLLAPLLAVLAVVAVVTNAAQTGLVLSLEPLTPKFQRVNPMANAKKLLLSWQGLVSLVKGLVKFGVVGAVAFFTLRSRQDDIVGLTGMGVRDGTAAFASLTFDVTVRCAAALLLVAFADYAFQRWQFGRDTRMTKQEVRDEMRQSEGDPQTRARIRRQRQALLARTMTKVMTADVIITNPTTLAVALKYDALTMRAPTVVAKGQRLMAERIKGIAAEHTIPVVENVPLARALFRSVPVGREVPADLYQAVAAVLAFVYRLRYGRPARETAPEPLAA